MATERVNMNSHQQFSSGMMAVAMRYQSQLKRRKIFYKKDLSRYFRVLINSEANQVFGYWIKRIIINTALNHQRSKLYLYPMVDVDDLKEGMMSLSVDNLAVEDLMDLVQKTANRLSGDF